MPALDALLAKATFGEALVEPAGRAHVHRMAEVFFEEDATGTLGASHRTPDDLVEAWRRQVVAAEAFYVDPLMCDVVTAAAPSMPEETLLPEDLPSGHGFVLIPGGVGQINPYGRLVVINAVLWSTTDDGVDLLMLTDKTDLRDYYNAELADDAAHDRAQAAHLAGIPRWLPSSLFHVTFGAPLPTLETFAATLPAHIHVDQRTLPDGTAQLHILREDGTPAHVDDVPDLDFGTHPDPVTRWLVAMWRLMQQSLATVTDEPPPRQLRRQLERRNVPDRKVSVVTLRRLKKPTTGEREVTWTHRWIRRGHWRQQPYKENGDWVRRAIWIHPTICGPDDKPLLVRDRVYSLKR